MKRFFYLSLMFLGLLSCKSVEYIPIKSGTDSLVIEKLIPVPQEADSSVIRALVECDEQGRAILKDLDIANSKNARSDFQLDSLGNIIAGMRTLPDTVYVPGKEIRISEKVEIPIPVEKKLSAWQQTKINYGGWAIIIVFVFILIIVGCLVYKIKK